MPILSKVTFSQITDRMDAEYFHPSYLKMEKTLDQISKDPNFRIVTLESISSKIRKGIFSILKSEYTNQGIPFIRVSNIKNLTIAKEELTYISEERNAKEEKTCLHPQDIVISKGGMYVGQVALIPSSMPEVNISQDIIGISIKSHKAIPEYVCLYLNSRLGQLWFGRNRSRLTQPHLELNPIRMMPIPLPLLSEQEKIASWIKEATEDYRRAEEYYAESQRLLNAILGLAGYKPERKKAFQVPFSEIEKSDRWSSEQHLPEYSDLIEKTKANRSLIPFGKLLTVSKKTLNPKDQPERNFRYIELASISASFGAIEEHSNVLGHEAPSRARMLLSKNDVLIPYLSGSFDKIAIVTEDYDSAIGSTGFYVTRSKEYDSWFLLTLLRSEIFLVQLRQKVAGTIMQSVSESSLKETLLPIIPIEEQKPIAAMMKNAHASLKHSKEMVQKAVAYQENAFEESLAD